MLKKNWTVFWIVEAISVIFSGLFLLLGDFFVGLAAIILYGLFTLWWGLYYNSLEYIADKNTISINRGVIFKRSIILKTENILWKMRLSIPICKNSALTVLHTAGGTLVIFCDFSTDG